MGSGPIRTVLVTGGAVRLGREIALALAAKGWNIALHYNTSKADAEQAVKDCYAHGVQAQAFAADLARPEAIAALIAAITRTMGPLTGLVNSAALFTRDTLETLTPESWQAHHAVNTLAPVLLTQAFTAQMPDGEKGSVVNLVDGCEGLCLSPAFFTYSISKYALMDATRLMAATLAPRIRVNAVGPGLTLPKSGEEAMFARLVEKLPLGVATEPRAIADAVCFLMMQESITGQILNLNGGADLSAWAQNPFLRK